MKRIDAHQHFWRYQPARDTWITHGMSAIARDFLPADLEPLLAAQQMDGCIAVQADMSPEETTFLLGLAKSHAFIKGVVGWTDLRSPTLSEELETYAAEPRLLGFRHILQAEPEGFMTSDDFIGGVSALAECDYSYDILVYYHQLQETIRFIDRLPEMRLVIDHIAKPDIRSGQQKGWAEALRMIAGFPHVHIKLSGLITEADWRHWRVEEILPYTDLVLECFGPDRVLFGSDWPVCLLAGSYERVIGLAQTCIAGLSEQDRAKIMGENAIRFYKLNDAV
ncbi:MAG: amidohydrolase family protein [Lewinellaceae bacterium]|nr:amidohydrolase family protein [Lewinellaceae bacterium]